MNNSIVYNKDNTMKIFLKNGLCEEVIKIALKNHTNEVKFSKDLFPFSANGITIYGACEVITVKYDSEDNKNNIIKALEEKIILLKVVNKLKNISRSYLQKAYNFFLFIKK